MQETKHRLLQPDCRQDSPGEPAKPDPQTIADRPDHTLHKETQKSVSEKLSRGTGCGMAPVSRCEVR